MTCGNAFGSWIAKFQDRFFPAHVAAQIAPQQNARGGALGGIWCRRPDRTKPPSGRSRYMKTIHDQAEGLEGSARPHTLLLTLDEAATELRCARRSIERHVAARHMDVVRIGRSVRIERSELERFIARQREGAAGGATA